MPVALLFYNAILPTYTQSFNYRSKGSAATNFFRAVLVPCSVQSVRAQLSHKWFIPPSGRVSTLAHAVLLSVTAVLPFSCSNLRWQWDDTTHKHSKHYPKWRKPWAVFWTVHQKEFKKPINRDLGRLQSVTNGNKMASCYNKYRKNSKIEILLENSLPCFLQGRLHPC